MWECLERESVGDGSSRFIWKLLTALILKLSNLFQEVKWNYRCDWWADGHHQQGRRPTQTQPRWQQYPGNQMHHGRFGFKSTLRCSAERVIVSPSPSVTQVISEQSDPEASAAKIPSFFPPGPLPPNIPPPPFLPPPPNVSAAPPLIPPPSMFIIFIFFNVIVWAHCLIPWNVLFLACRVAHYCPSSWFPSSTEWTASIYHPHYGQVTLTMQ